jgi:phenylpropionate dioxygenase-like ring-hydroxylating dioxygenase large terminal subunit
MTIEYERRSSTAEGIVQEMGSSIEQGLVPAAIFNDPEIHRLELERVFARAWCFIGHESEIAHPGDYCQRYIGQDPFIFVRDEAGRVRVLFDGCRHRGALVCRAEKGNASHFRCSYHGWTYKNTGELIGAPAFKDAYGVLDKSEWGLLPAAHVASVNGFVFATLDPNAPSLDEYLGDFRWYMELMWGLADSGLEVVGEPQRWVMEANWKQGADNFAGDDYHTLFLHKSMFEIGVYQIPPRANMFGYHVQVGNGHQMSFSIAPDRDDPGPKFWGYDPEVVKLFNPENVTSEQFELAYRSRVSVGTIFPNFSFLQVPLTHDPKNVAPQGLLTVRQWQPRSSGQMEVWVWCLVWKDMPDHLKELSYRASMGTFSASGIFEQDDAEPWQSIARTAGTVFARKAGLKFNFQMGLSGFGGAQRATDWPGPGIAFWPRYEEGVQRSLYRRWLQFMTSEEYPPSISAAEAAAASTDGHVSGNGRVSEDGDG